jgi:hypothetical protein
VTSGLDGTIMTWNLGDWSAEFRTDKFFGTKWSVQQDERTMVRELSGGDTLAIVAEPAVWKERACEIAGRVLTEKEWSELFGARPYTPACRD